MNYYQDTRNGYSMNNRNDYRYYNDEYYYDEYSRNNTKDYYDNDCNKNGYGYDKNRSCCVRRVEETFSCFPSYYNEEKKDYKNERCFEGTFTIHPKHYNYNNDCYDYNKNDDHKCGCRFNNRCGFCGLFRRW